MSESEEQKEARMARAKELGLPPFQHNKELKTGHFRTMENGRKKAITKAQGRRPGQGRISILTEELIDRLYERTLDGCPAEIIRASLGVTGQCWREWKQKAEEGSVLHIRLFEVLEIAEGKGGEKLYKLWKKLTLEDKKAWASPLAMLERRFCDLFARPEARMKMGSDIININLTASSALEEASTLALQSITFSQTALEAPEAPEETNQESGVDPIPETDPKTTDN